MLFVVNGGMMAVAPARVVEGRSVWDGKVVTAVLRRMFLILALVPCFSLSTASMGLELRGDGSPERDFTLGFDVDPNLNHATPAAWSVSDSSWTFKGLARLASPLDLTGSVSTNSFSGDVARPSYSSRTKSAAATSSRRGTVSSHFDYGLNYNFPLFTPNSSYAAPKKQTQSAVVTSAATSSSSKTLQVIRINGRTPAATIPASQSLTFSDEGTGEVSPNLVAGFIETLLVDCTGECGETGEKVPEPGVLFLLGLGLTGLAVVRRRRRVQPA